MLVGGRQRIALRPKESQTNYCKLIAKNWLCFERKQRTLLSFTSTIGLGTADAEDEAARKLDEMKKLEKLLGDIDLGPP